MNAIPNSHTLAEIEHNETTAHKLVYATPFDNDDDPINGREIMICEAVERATWAAGKYHKPYYVYEHNGCIFAGGACPDWDDSSLIHVVEP